MATTAPAPDDDPSAFEIDADPYPAWCGWGKPPALVP